jgi:pimeloyl-ACP methyl ester carboxylesterase
MTAKTKDLQPFTVQIADQVLEDLRARLKATRWATDLNNEDEFYGLSTRYMKEMVGYWLDEFDWRRVEQRLNTYKQFRVDINGDPVHFIHERGKGPKPIPLLLSHGWPWTYWHWSKIIRPLTDPASFGGNPADAFDVIVPSLPGFGFSSPLKSGDMNHWKMADVFHTLMTDVLGYEKFGMSGADYGSLIGSQLGHKYARDMYAIHLGHDLLPQFLENNDRAWDFTHGQSIPTFVAPEVRKAYVHFTDTYASHNAVHMMDSQTLTHGLTDSPVGMLAWILHRWKRWSDLNADFETVFPKEEIITNAMIYWVTETIGTSIRIYRNANRYAWKPSHHRTPMVEAPAGFTFLTGDAYPPGATPENRVDMFKNGPTGSFFKTIYAKAHARGAHFSPWENPDAFLEGIRETFRLVRD